MTQPGSIIPPSPGWWPRTERIGTNATNYGWSCHAHGVAPPALAMTGTMSATCGVTKDTVHSTLSGTGTLSATAYRVGVYDATGAGYTGTSLTPSYDHILGANATAIVVVGSIYSQNDPPTVTAKVDTTDMSLLGHSNAAIVAATGYYDYLFAFGLLSPPTGTRSISLNISSGGTVNAINSVSYRGVTGFGTVAKVESSGANPSHTVSGTAGVVQAFTCATNNYSSYTKTQRWKVDNVAFTNLAMVLGDSLASGSSTFDVTQASDSWGSIAVPFT